MKIANNVTELVGNTPLVRINQLAAGLPATVAAKLEFFSPAHSVKDRIGLAMITNAEERGILRKGGTIIEPTSGNRWTDSPGHHHFQRSCGQRSAHPRTRRWCLERRRFFDLISDLEAYSK